MAKKQEILHLLRGVGYNLERTNKNHSVFPILIEDIKSLSGWNKIRIITVSVAIIKIFLKETIHFFFGCGNINCTSFLKETLL